MTEAKQDAPVGFYDVAMVISDPKCYQVIYWDTYRGSISHRQGMGEVVASFPLTPVGELMAEHYKRILEGNA